MAKPIYRCEIFFVKSPRNMGKRRKSTSAKSLRTRRKRDDGKYDDEILPAKQY
jgi:hypothetical protein